jgi:nitric oxide reductase NorE protein
MTSTMTSTMRRRTPKIARAPHIPGESGVWLFIFGDMIVFAILFLTYLIYRSEDVSGFADAQGLLNQNFGALNTVVLLVSSLFVVFAGRCIRLGLPNAHLWIAGAIGCGLIFSILKFVEYGGKLADGISLSTNEFFMFYFVLTGLHWFHLLIGVAALAGMYRLSLKSELSGSQLSYFECGASFWHMVDLLWIVIFPMLYLVR